MTAGSAGCRWCPRRKWHSWPGLRLVCIDLCEPREGAAGHDRGPGQFTVSPLSQCSLPSQEKYYFIYFFIPLREWLAHDKTQVTTSEWINGHSPVWLLIAHFIAKRAGQPPEPTDQPPASPGAGQTVLSSPDVVRREASLHRLSPDQCQNIWTDPMFKASFSVQELWGREQVKFYQKEIN